MAMAAELAQNDPAIDQDATRLLAEEATARAEEDHTRLIEEEQQGA